MNYSPIHSHKPIQNLDDSNISDLGFNDPNLNDIETNNKQNNLIINSNTNNLKKNKLLEKFQDIIFGSVGKYILNFAYLIVGLINLYLSTIKNECLDKEINYPTISLSEYFEITGILGIIYFIFIFDKIICDNFILKKILKYNNIQEKSIQYESGMRYYYFFCFLLALYNQVMTIEGVILLNKLVIKSICSTSILYYLLFQIVARLCELLLFTGCIFIYPIAYCYCLCCWRI